MSVEQLPKPQRSRDLCKHPQSKLSQMLVHNALKFYIALNISLSTQDPYDCYDRRASSIAPESWEKHTATECARNHLSNVTLYESSKSIQKCGYMGFSKFLLMRTKALKRFSIKYQGSKDQQHPFAAELERGRGELQQWPRASPGALVEFSVVDRLPWL